MLKSTLRSGTTRGTRSGGTALVALVLSVVMTVVGSAEPVAASAAEVTGCAAAGSSFATESIEDGGAALRMGCARDAGNLRSLARSDDDLMAVIDFGPVQRPEQLRQLMRQMVDDARADRADGHSLSEFFTRQAQKNSVGFYQQPTDDVRYDGSVQAVGDSLVVVVPAAEVGTTGFWDGFWKKFVTGLAATAAGIVSGALCLAAFNVGAPATAPVCAAVAGGMAGGVGELVSAALDGKPIDAEVWGAALGTAIWGALAGAFTGALVEFAVAGSSALVADAQTTLRRYAAKLGNWGNPLGAVADVLNGNAARRFLETLQRLQRGVGSWAPLGEVVDDAGEGSQTRFLDIDGDGDADRVVAGSGGRIRAWRNDGARDWSPMGDITPESAAQDDGDPPQVFFGDVDGDDRDDYIRILGADESPTGFASMRVWRNESTAEAVGWAEPRTVANDLGYTGDLLFVDIDGDGDDDLLVKGRLSYITAWENTGHGLPSEGDWKTIGFGYPMEGPSGELSFADITGDGRADVVLVEYVSGDVFAWENTGGPWSLTTGWRSLGTIRSGDAFAGTAGAFADLDADLVADFLLFNGGSGGVDGWLLPRYGSGGQGPGQPRHPQEPAELPAGTLPAYSGGQPRPRLDGRLLQNSNFTGTSKPWWFNAGMTPKLQGGVLCVDVPASEKPWDVLVGHNSIYLPGGSPYTLRFRARTSAAAKPIVRIGPFDNPDKIEYFARGFTTGESWKHYAYTFTTSYSDAYVLSQLQFRLGAADKPYEFCMDDVSLDGKEFAHAADTGPAVKVNQHGYLPNSPKRATLVTDAANALPWTLRGAGGGTVATGTTEPGGFDASAGASVHTIDFSGVSATGTFRLAVGGEESHSFDIRPDLYDSLRTDSMRFFYTNRSGIAIDGGIAGAAYARPAGHLGSAPNTGDTQVPCQTPKSYVDNWTCDYTLDVTGGWYDAGDHGKYVVNGGIATYQLLSAWERAVAEGSQAQLGDSALAVPERGNGVPDILDEARWNLEFMLRMQVPDGRPLAGMVHHKVHDESWTGPPTLPHQDKKKRELHRPSTAATLNLAAVAAQGARIYERFDPGFAARLRSAAERAYTAARAEPALYAPRADRVGGGPYNDSDVSDEFYWAAAELYLTTKRGSYLDDVRSSRFHTAGAAFSQNGFYWGSVAALAQLDLARFGDGLTEHAKIRTWVTAAADRLISFQRAERFGQTYTPTTGKYDWGSNAAMLNNQVVLATAYDLTGTDAYADAAFEGFDYLFGRNALGQSYITGYGANDAKNQHSRWYAKSFDASLPNPPVGTVAGGPNSSLQDPLASSWLHGCAPQLCYVDNLEAWSLNEITINWNSALAWMSAFAADVAGRP
ncbi:glycoside hydrolase family 9 protein [Streptomyces sp. C10-9-1]|uniref:glycoside hydrolase family 9 protein n=1 Tax=Streptomyces sp. C10-9-1 TaxID=1859285 RepID=UPI003F4A621F